MNLNLKTSAANESIINHYGTNDIISMQ